MLNKTYQPVFLLTIGLFTIFACDDGNSRSGWEKEIKDTKQLFDSFESEIDVKTEIFVDDTINLRRPFYFKFVQDFMIIVDRDDSTHLSIYDVSKKAFIKRFLRKGRGPNEYLHPYLNNFGDDSIMILDADVGSNVNIFSINSILKSKNEPDRIIRFSKSNENDVVKKSFFINNSFICNGLFEKGRYSIYNLNGEIQNSFGSYPTVSSSVDYDNYHLGYIFSGREVISSNSKFSKVASIDHTSFSIYSYNDQSKDFDLTFFLNWHTQEIREATYREGKPYVARNGEGAKIGAGYVAVNDKHLFFPFSKYEFLELVKQGVHDYYGYIFVFDWDGNPVAKLKLDKRIQFPLEINNDEKKLYSTHVDPLTGFAKIISIDISFL